MTENAGSANSVSINVLSDLNSFFRSGEGKSDDEEILLKNYTQNNPLQIKTSSQSEQSPLTIKLPESKEQTNPLQMDTLSQSVQSPLEIKRAETNTELKPISLPKQKQTILYELRTNAMSSKLTAWDIAKKYGISYIQAQEIFIELNQDKNGIVKEFNLPENSTVSYLV